MKATAYKNGQDLPLPDGTECIVIETSKGPILIDLSRQVPGMVLAQAVKTNTAAAGGVRLVLSPMESGRLAVGVIGA
jgi:hypothetical protein